LRALVKGTVIKSFAEYARQIGTVCEHAMHTYSRRVPHRVLGNILSITTTIPGDIRDIHTQFT